MGKSRNFVVPSVVPFVALTTQPTQTKKDHHNEQLTISRDQCLRLNDIARLLTVVP